MKASKCGHPVDTTPKIPTHHTERCTWPTHLRRSGGVRTQKEPAKHSLPSQITSEIRWSEPQSRTTTGATEERDRACLDAGSFSHTPTCRPTPSTVDQPSPDRYEPDARYPDRKRGPNSNPGHPIRGVPEPDHTVRPLIELGHWCELQVGDGNASPACSSAAGPLHPHGPPIGTSVKPLPAEHAHGGQHNRNNSQEPQHCNPKGSTAERVRDPLPRTANTTLQTSNPGTIRNEAGPIHEGGRDATALRHATPLTVLPVLRTPIEG